jgi:hypothetical protein
VTPPEWIVTKPPELTLALETKPPELIPSNPELRMIGSKEIPPE